MFVFALVLSGCLSDVCNAHNEGNMPSVHNDMTACVMQAYEARQQGWTMAHCQQLSEGEMP
jgi:hypothetical protein